MARSQVLVALAAALAMASWTPRVAAEEPSVRLTSGGDGTLAVAPADGQPWTVLTPGDPLPARCRLRSAAGGVCELQLPGGSLVIAGGSQLELDATRRHVVLATGRVLLQTGDRAGSCDAGGGHFDLAANSQLEVTASADSFRAASVRGSAVASHPGWPPLALGEKQAVGWKSTDNGWSPQPLAEDDLRAIAARSLARTAQGLGQLLIADTQAGSATRLNIARYHVNVVLEPPVALVQIDQSFYNPLSRQEEGTFVFNLPSGASVSRFAMYVSPTSLIEGELIERKQAAGIYQSIVNRRRDPAILEQIGDNLFKMRVFPVPPNDSKRILLDFTLPLETRDGQYVFRLPLLSDLQPIWDFRITGSLRGPTLPGSVQVDPPYDLHPAPRDGAIGFDLSERMFQPRHDLTVRFRQNLAGAAAVRSFAADRRDSPQRWNYFWAALPADVQAGPPEVSPADVLVLLDSSGSGQDRQRMTETLNMLLTSLRPTDRFRLACVDITARPLGAWQAAEPARVAAALAAFDKELLFGGVDLTASLAQALALKEPQGRRPMIVYLGDANDSVSQSTTGQLADTLRKQLVTADVPLFAAKMQRAGQGQALLEAMAAASGGLVFDVNLAEGKRNLFAWLLAGLPLPTRIQSLQMPGVAAEDLFYPPAWPAGQVLPIIGRCAPGQPLEISAVLGRKGAERPLKVALQRPSRQDDVFVGRCWAQRKLAALRVQADSVLTSDALREQIIALSQEWSLLSPHTAFLVLESEQDYVTWKIDRRQRHRYWRPLEARVEEPLPEHWLRLVTPDRPALARDELRWTLAVARAALQRRNIEPARNLLRWIERQPDGVLDPQYKALLTQVQQQEARRTRSAFRARQLALDTSRQAEEELHDPPQLARLLVGEVSSEFLERFPHASRLLQDARARRPAAPPKSDHPPEPATLTDVIRQFEAATGVHVLLDKRALDDVGSSADIPIQLRLHNPAPLSWRSYLHMVLGPLDLAMIENGRRLTITTREKADAAVSLEVYPVADLLLADRLPDRKLASNPYLDLRLSSEQRIKSKLKRAIFADFQEWPVDDVADYFANSLGINVLLDTKALEDAGTGADSPATFQLRGEPAGESLRLLLEPMDLAYVIRDEALLITTKEKAAAAVRVRLHNGAGVVYESARPAASVRGGRGRGGMGGGMGSMMGGMGMGMGGMMAGGGIASAQQVAGVQDDTPVARRAPETAVPQTAAPASAALPAAEPAQAGAALRISGGASSMPAAAPAGAAGPIVAVHDIDSVTDLITTTIAPTSWGEASGPGDLAFFAPTLDFVVETTDEIHDQIDDLFSRLRKLPVVAGPQGRAALHGRPVGIEEGRPALQSLRDIITTIVAPTSWDEVGGPSSIATDNYRLALVLSASGGVHESVSELLAMLRRSRLGIHAWRPEVLLAGSGHDPLVDALAVAAEKTRAARRPATNEALQLLRVRHEPGAGSWRWRRTDEHGGRPADFTVKRSAARLELDTPGWIARCEGEDAAIAYPGLTLFERGPWAPAVRDLLDGRLPWWPHRTNRELAERFEIAPAPSAPAEPAGAVWLRFWTPGTDQADFVQVAFSREQGLPLLWQSYLGGQLFQSIRFAEAATGKAPHRPQATLETADGQALLRWTLAEQSADDPHLADSTAGWPDYVELHPAAGDGPLGQGLAAARKSDWPATVRIFQAARQERPGQPLLVLLWAWSVMQAEADEPRPAEGTKPIALEALVEVLQGVARHGASGLMRFISPGNFPMLSPKELLAVLEAQPAKLRAAADWQRLIATASEARQTPQALAYSEEAARFAPDEAQQFACERWRIDVLVAAHRPAEAARSAEAWVGRHPHARPADLASLACMLAEQAQAEAADRIMRQVFSAAELPDEVKSELASRYADSQSGLPRWRSLVQAIQFLPSGVKPQERAELIRQLIAELNFARPAEACEQLAQEITDRDLQAEVQLLLAHITSNLGRAGDVFWSLRERGLLPALALAAACSKWNSAGQPQRTIAALEPQLRLGTARPELVFWPLATAYEAVGRKADARRAASQPPKSLRSENAPPQPPFPRDPFGNSGGMKGVIWGVDGRLPALRDGGGSF